MPKQKSYRFWFLAYPDLPKPVGGIKQIHRLAEFISSTIHKAIVVQDTSSFHPNWFESNVETIAKSEFFELTLDPDSDLIVFAETYLPLVPKLFPSIKKIIFNQNGSYTFGLPGTKFVTPDSVLRLYNHGSIVQIWCVSEFDFRLLVQAMDLDPTKVFVIRNPLEVEYVRPGKKKNRSVAYMPRKNPHDSNVVIALLDRYSGLDDWTFAPIDKLSHKDAISILQEASIFLSFGHPEGFGLPVAEAMACGCAVVGYSGLGGRELFNLGREYSLAAEVQYGDWESFVRQVKIMQANVDSNIPLFLRQARRLSNDVLGKYGVNSFNLSISQALTKL